MAEVAITINFDACLQTPQELVFYDTSLVNSYTNFEINTLIFTLRSDYIPEEIYNVDVIPYIYSARENREWYKVTSDMIGVSEGEDIPDGIYTATFIVNNATTVTHSFVVYQAAEAEALALLNEAGFLVDTDSTNLLYQNSDKYDFETMSIVYSLLNSIKTNSLDGNMTGAEEALLKLQKTLKIVQTEGYNII